MCTLLYVCVLHNILLMLLVELVSLLNWRNAHPKIHYLPTILMNVKYIDGEEIVKFLPDILNCLFDILAEDAKTYGEHVFNALVILIKSSFMYHIHYNINYINYFNSIIIIHYKAIWMCCKFNIENACTYMYMYISELLQCSLYLFILCFLLRISDVCFRYFLRW